MLLDGATGSNLMRAGMPRGICTEVWVTEHPEPLLALQRDYIAAGSQIIYAPTFCANRRGLARCGRENDVALLNRQLVALSREAAGGRALVAGETLESYQTRTHMVVEGVPASVSVLELAQERGIEVPITAAVHSVLFEGRPIDDAMEGLLTRAPRTEFYGMEEREQASKENQC